MEETHSKYRAYQTEKVFVILLPNAIIQPSAVMIEVVNASVTLAAMLGVVLHMSGTDLTEKVVRSVVKVDPISKL